MAPTVYVIAGPNGAGKTTFASKFLPDFVHCKEFLNADLIAAGLSPFDPESQSVAAGKIMLQRMDELTQKRESFSFESTLSGRGYIKKFDSLRERGYEIEIFFLWLPHVENAVIRVANRVRQGGHNIPEQVIRRRYNSGARNFWNTYRHSVDRWHLYDGSCTPPSYLAKSAPGHLTVLDDVSYKQFTSFAENLHD
ncbi:MULTISPECIES: zeta toxin family protein [Pirellulaceae]|uniref:zeta toxin family protein n=1 Tax=Pirellulaceae TaxID=2691357 RepID=UPI000DF3A518|nr:MULTISPECIES: zeta toxin family protein [Pirellulaceae]RCS52553.1 Zeta toxin family protein [Bremerella cremea]